MFHYFLFSICTTTLADRLITNHLWLVATLASCILACFLGNDRMGTVSCEHYPVPGTSSDCELVNVKLVNTYELRPVKKVQWWTTRMFHGFLPTLLVGSRNHPFNICLVYKSSRSPITCGSKPGST